MYDWVCVGACLTMRGWRIVLDVSGCVCPGMRAGSVAAVGCGFGGVLAGLRMSGHARRDVKYTEFGGSACD